MREILYLHIQAEVLTLEYITTHVYVRDIAIKILWSFNVCLLS